MICIDYASLGTGFVITRFNYELWHHHERTFHLCF